jgi:acetyltransferase-like isoleucine patch superfamily enzyme
MKNIIFIGSNSNLKQMIDICELNKVKIEGILDQDYWGNTETLQGLPVIGNENTFNFSDSYDYYIATNWTPYQIDWSIRDRKKRLAQIALIENKKIRCVNLIHPSAVVPSTVVLGHSIMIGAYAVIGNHVILSNYCQIREHSYLAHTSEIAQNTILQVQSYVGSYCKIGSNCYVGIKSSIIPNIPKEILTLPEWSFVKAHSLCTNTDLHYTAISSY